MSIEKLVIIGGVAGGATAAARARRLGEDVEIVVLERGPHVSFANCGLPYHIGGEIPDRDKLLLQSPAGLKARHNLDVRVRHEVLSIDRAKKEVVVRDIASERTYREPYDKLIISTGAAPVRPPLPGIDHSRIMTLRNVPDTDAIKKVVDNGAASAIIVGGGFIGLEMAENLRRRGLEVHLVEVHDQVMSPMDREMASAIADTLRLNGVRLHLGDAVEAFSPADGDGAAVSARLSSGATLTADLVVLAVGVRPESSLAEAAGLELGVRGSIKTDVNMRTSDPDIYAVGDAVSVGDFVTGEETIVPLAGPANRQGRIAADNAFGRPATYRGTQGTSILRVFELTVAMTGKSEKALRKAGIDFEKVYIHPMQHVGYYPGATGMHIKLLFSRPLGRVLGAQITGGEGVDKRIDVLATAIQAGMTVFDLEQVELAYAPQFGAAKDPINMAGFAAANVLKKDVVIVHADEIDTIENAVLLDVRTAAEHDVGAILGSLHIPLDELRGRHRQLPRDRRILVYCAAGLRGYVASRILTQLGYDVVNLSGGYKTWKAFQPGDPAENVADRTSSSGGCGCPVKAESSSADAVVASKGKGGSPVVSCGQGAAPDDEEPAALSGEVSADETLDVRGEQCPGPLVALGKAVGAMREGSVLKVLATDPGFVADAGAWCRQAGHELLGVERENGHCVAMIRKQAAATEAAGETATKPPAGGDRTIVVFSGDLDKAMASMIIANGAAAMGRKVTLFFTFWGLNLLRRPDGRAAGKSIVDRMFGWMMPRGARKAGLSKMNMAGAGTAMMKWVMNNKNVASLPELMATAAECGVRMVACAMSLDVMGIKPEELIDGVEIGGVGTYLDAADSANVNLFI